jgi:hypothetical protein
MCAKQALLQLTRPHKKQCKNISLELLARCGAKGNNFISHIVMGDETQLHYSKTHTHKKKRQSMKGHHVHSPQKKKFKVAIITGAGMATVCPIAGVSSCGHLPHLCSV